MLRLAASRDVFNCGHRWPTCHCASLVQAADGQLVAAWYAGMREGSRDQAILVSRCCGPAYVWEPATPVVDTPGLADGNPVVWVDEDERLWLYYVTIVGQWWAECKVLARQADGRGWCEPVVLRHELGWMLRARPLTLAGGRLLFPWYDERDWSGHVMVRDSGGWQRRGDCWQRRGHVTAPQGLIQPCLAQRRDGTVVMYLRTGGKDGFIWSSESGDEGDTWSYPEPTALPNPNSGIDVLAHSSGLWLMAYNPVARGRTPLSVAVSEDEGRSWRVEAVAESGPGEFSYPQMVEDDRGLVHLLYTYKRVAIRQRIYEVAP